jgi:hypothetical protein
MVNNSGNDDSDVTALTGDEPPLFGGRPRVGGGQDPLATDRAMAMDHKLSVRSRNARSFAQRYPGAARIEHV